MNYPGLQSGGRTGSGKPGFSPKQTVLRDILKSGSNLYGSPIHCLVSLGSGQNIDQNLQLLKGESSCWINKGNLLHKR
jgi:hypothetical protein